MVEAFTVTSLINELREWEKNGWGATIIVNSEGVSFCELNVKTQYDGEEVLVIN